MKDEIVKWLEENKKMQFVELPQSDTFIDFLLTLISVNREKAISDTSKCAAAVADKDIESFSGCLNERLNNPNPRA